MLNSLRKTMAGNCDSTASCWDATTEPNVGSGSRMLGTTCNVGCDGDHQRGDGAKTMRDYRMKMGIVPDWIETAEYGS